MPKEFSIKWNHNISSGYPHQFLSFTEKEWTEKLKSGDQDVVFATFLLEHFSSTHKEYSKVGKPGPDGKTFSSISTMAEHSYNEIDTFEKRKEYIQGIEFSGCTNQLPIPLPVSEIYPPFNVGGGIKESTDLGTGMDIFEAAKFSDMVMLYDQVGDSLIADQGTIDFIEKVMSKKNLPIHITGYFEMEDLPTPYMAEDLFESEFGISLEKLNQLADEFGFKRIPLSLKSENDTLEIKTTLDNSSEDPSVPMKP